MTKTDYETKHRILEQGWIHSATINGACIIVRSRKGCEDYSNILVSYIKVENKHYMKNDDEIYFRLTKKLPTYEELKALIMFDKISDDKIKEIHEFLSSPDRENPKRTVHHEIKSLFKTLEYEKIPNDLYIKMKEDGSLKTYINL